jgi:PII-like signaling protein
MKGNIMKLPSEARLLRIFIGEADKFEGKPLFEAIINLARKQNMQGATILRGLMGFGADSRMHSANILRLSEDLPVVIEIVDSAEKIEGFLPLLDNMIKEGLVTLEKVDVVAYRNNTRNEK